MPEATTPDTPAPRRRRASTKRPTPSGPTVLGHPLVAPVRRAADLPAALPAVVREAHLRFLTDGRQVFRALDPRGRECLLVTNADVAVLGAQA